MKTITYLYMFMVLVLIVSCNSSKKEIETVKKIQYMDDIGNTKFNAELDNVNFVFCDSTDVLHQITRVSYKGGTRAMEKELIDSYEKRPEYESFTGYFFIRFAVNCKNQSGRFRWEIVNEEFKETTCPKLLENEIISKVKKLKYWNPPIYEEEIHDGYKYIVVKIENGNIILS